MSIWLKVMLIVLAAVLASIGAPFIALDNAPSSPAPHQKSLQHTNPVFYALVVRPPQPAVHACMSSVKRSALTSGESALSHEDFVRLANCLRRTHLVSANTVAAVESDRSLGQTVRVVLAPKTKPETFWWWFLIWGLALVLIIFLIHRHRRRPPRDEFLQPAAPD